MKIIEDGTVTNPKGYKGAGLHIGIKKRNKDFWSNSSGNEIVRRFIDKADIQTKNVSEKLNIWAVAKSGFPCSSN